MIEFAVGLFLLIGASLSALGFGVWQFAYRAGREAGVHEVVSGAIGDVEFSDEQSLAIGRYLHARSQPFDEALREVGRALVQAGHRAGRELEEKLRAPRDGEIDVRMRHTSLSIVQFLASRGFLQWISLDPQRSPLMGDRPSKEQAYEAAYALRELEHALVPNICKETEEDKESRFERDLSRQQSLWAIYPDDD